MKKIKVIIFSFLFYSFLLANISFAFAASPIKNWDKEGGQTSALNKTAGFSETVTVGDVVATVIRAFLGFLGIIFVVLIVINGYKWMNAGGDSKQVEEAGSAIRHAIIGLIIIVSAYAITYFVFKYLPGAGGPSGGGTGTQTGS